MTDPGREHAQIPPRELLVMRHGKSSWDSDASTDRDRPLADRGERDAPRVGAWLASHGLVPDLILCSPALRASRTVELLLPTLGGTAPPVRHDERIYATDLASLLEVLGECPPDVKRVLLVGHNPDLEVLVQFLAEDWQQHAGERKFFPTCALAHLEAAGTWDDLAGGSATLVEIVRPKEMDG